jgi:four helix bundle protein
VKEIAFTFTEKQIMERDNLENFGVYKLAMELWDLFWKDSELMIKDVRGKKIAEQLTRSVYSISANIEEGYGRGFGKEYPQFLRYARGSARETKGGYTRARFLIGEEKADERILLINKIISGLNNTLKTLQTKDKK